jgi:hypothetical protein
MARREGDPMKAPILLVLAGLSISLAHAAEPEKLTLACNGKVTETGMMTGTYPVNVGIVVDMQRKKVIGLREHAEDADIVSVEETLIRFRGGKPTETEGTLDRINGQMFASFYARDNSKPNSPPTWTERFDLICKPANRLF